MQTGNDSDDDWEYTPKPMTDEAFDENLEYFKSHPLFLNKLPENYEQNEAFSALQNIAFDDEPINIAKSLNNKGREILARGSQKYYLREALKTYEDALLQDFNDDELKSRINSNKSLVHYKLKNYGKAIEDAMTAIKLNPSFIKPYYRCAQGYLVLDKFEDVIKISEQGLQIDPQCKEIINIKKEAEREIEKAKEREAKRKLETNNKQSQLIENFKSRGYTLGRKRIHEIPNAYQMDPFVDDEGALNFVTIITYLEFGQMDVIQRARDTDLLSDHLKEIFKERLPWDERGYYNYKDLAIFVELNCIEPMYKSSNHTNFERGFLRIGRRKQLSEILKINGVVMPYVLEINVLSRASPFFDKFMKDFDILKGV